MTKEDLLNVIISVGSRFNISNSLENNEVNNNLAERFNNINENTSYQELLKLMLEVKKIAKDQDQVVNNLVIFLQNEANKEQIQSLAPPTKEKEDKEKLPEAKSNVTSLDNPNKETLKNVIKNSKDDAEKNSKGLRVHVSLNDNQIIINVTQFGENVTGNEQSYSISVDRYLFAQEGMMTSINEALIAEDKIENANNQRFYNGKTVQTNYGHELIIDPNVTEAINETDRYMDEREVKENTKSGARVRKDDSKQGNIAAASNIVVFFLILVIILIVGLIVFLTIYS